MVNLPKVVKKSLADVLLQEGLVPANHLMEAQNRQKASGESLAPILLKMGVVSEIELARAYCKQLNLPFMDVTRYAVPKEVVDLFPLEEMQANHLLVLDKIGKVLLMAVSESPSLEFFEALESKTGSVLFLFMTTPSQMTACLRKHFMGSSPSKPGGDKTPAGDGSLGPPGSTKGAQQKAKP